VYNAITTFWNVSECIGRIILKRWLLVNDFDQEQRRALLRLVTGCSRPPLLEFKELVSNFAIRNAGDDEHQHMRESPQAASI